MFKEEWEKYANEEREALLVELQEKQAIVENKIMNAQNISKICFLCAKYQRITESIEQIEKEIEEQEKEANND